MTKLRSRGKPVTVAAVVPSPAVEAWYRRKLEKMIEAMHKSILYWIPALYKQLVVADSLTTFIIAEDDFDEDLHPRDEHGRFSHGGMSSPDKGKTWHSREGTAVPEHVAERLKALKVPPAWTHVELNDDPTAPLQVKGKDSKGRTQYLYSREHTERAAAEKFARLKDFNAKLPEIRRAIDDDTKNGDETAACLRLVAQTGFRPGSDKETGGKHQAYGASTLTGRHVEVDGDHLKFDFVGKHGVHIEHELKDATLAKQLRSKAGTDQRLFHTSDEKMRDYMHRIAPGFKVKDFRTWNGTNTALHAIGGRKAKNEKEFRAIQNEVAKVVSSHLGNTPKVALESYISPEVWDSVRSF